MTLRWLLLAVSAPLLAQNSDFSLLWSYSHNRVKAGTFETNSYQLSPILNYAYQLRESGPRRLYVEFPFASIGDNSVVASTTTLVNNRNRVFFTPGLRYQLGLSSRFSIYGAAGAGVAGHRRNEVVVTSGRTQVFRNDSASGALNLGGGLDLRWTRLLSLRLELRNFSRLGGDSGSRHSLVFGGGFAFHF